MDQLIRYRYLAAELSTDELKLFCSKLIDDGQEELIISGIFNKLQKKIKQDKDLSNVQTINENLRRIIEERNVNNHNGSITSNKLSAKSSNTNIENSNSNDNSSVLSKQKSNPKPATVNLLSSSVINEIGSYLYLYDIVRMERVNRRFFVALRYPYPALRKINTSSGKINIWNWMKEYCNSQAVNQMPLDFQQFKSMTELYIVSDDIMEYEIYKLGRIFNKIKRLCIYFKSIGTYDQILNSNICNFESIQMLQLYYDTIQLFSAHSYLKTILMSPQVNQLILQNVSINSRCNHEIANEIKNSVNSEQIQQRLSKLEAFVATNVRLELYKPIIDIISNQIISLHINDPNALINTKCDPKYIGFPNLKEFCFRGTRNNVTIAINEIMKSTNKLEHVCIGFVHENQRINNNQQINFTQAMNNILSINSLRIIKLSVKHFPQSNIINILENAISNSNSNNQNSLEIIVKGMKLSSNILSSFVKTISMIRVWRPTFSFVFNSKTELADELKIKLAKVATIKKIKNGYAIWNKTENNAFDYGDKVRSHCCTHAVGYRARALYM